MPSSVLVRTPAATSRWCLIGHPDSRRVTGFREAVQRLSGGTTSAFSYTDSGSEELASVEPGAIVRLESPGESEAIARHLLTAGIEPLAEAGGVPVDAEAIRQMTFGRGEIHHPRQWYFGFWKVLGELDRRFAARGVEWMSTPGEVATAFDKRACLDRWRERGLPVPARWDGIATYHQLRQAVPERHARLFIKPRYGYSALGAIALEWRGTDVRAITTVETTWADGRPRLFTSKRPRVLTREFEIAWLLDTLAVDEIVVEEWLPKARCQGKPFDLRIVTIGQRAAHIVGRCSTSPFTNLNLDAVRLSRDVVAERLGAEWPRALELAEQAAAALPEAFVLGIDLLVRPCRTRFALLEANAFGDYLPKLLHQGRSTYEAAVHAFLARRSHRPRMSEERP